MGPPRGRVLLIDCRLDVPPVLPELLAQHGFPTRLVRDVEAMRAELLDPPDVILLDALPEHARRTHAGVESRILLVKTARPETTAIPVVVLSPSRGNLGLPRGLWTTVVKKPFDMPALVWALEELLRFEEEVTRPQVPTGRMAAIDPDRAA